MPPKELTMLLVTGMAIGTAFVAVIATIVRREFLRWATVIDRIPSKEWFDRVATSLDVLAGQAVMLSDHTGAICDLHTELDVLTSDQKADHDRLTTLWVEHKVRTCPHLEPEGPEKPFVERRKVAR